MHGYQEWVEKQSPFQAVNRPRRGVQGGDSVSAVNLGVYRSILRVRAAYPFDIGAFLMRFYVYMTNIGIITMLTLEGYSFLLAGLVSSTVALAMFLISPRISKLIDERGQSKVVPFAAVVTLAGLAIMLALVNFRGPEWALFIAAVLMGCVPSPQALARARWTYLIRTGKLGDGAPELRTMFSYEGVLDDIGFMFSPSISIALASSVTPIAGMMAGGVAFAIGAAALTLARSTEPEPGWGSNAGGAASSAQGAGGKAKSVIRTSSVVRVLFVFLLLVGAFFGVNDTTTVSFAEDVGDPNVASVVLMIASFISMITGFVFGMLNLRAAPYKQLMVCAVLIGCGYGLVAFINSVPTLYIVEGIAAVTYAPFLIVINAACERAVPGDRLTEAITWVNAGATCGMAFGPTAGGAIIEHFGTLPSFHFCAVLALAIPVTALLCFRIIKRDVKSEAYTEIAKSPVN